VAAIDATLALDPYIDAHVAVQDLEEKTRQASRALDLIEEAIKVTTEATECGPAMENGPTTLVEVSARNAEAPADAAFIAEVPTLKAMPSGNGVLITEAAETAKILAGLEGWHTPNGATPRGRTPTRGNTPRGGTPLRGGRSEPESRGENNAAMANVDAVLLRVPVDSQPAAPPPPSATVPVAAQSPTPAAGAEEDLERHRDRRRDLSVGSVISTAESTVSIMGSNLHGC